MTVQAALALVFAFLAGRVARGTDRVMSEKA